MTNVIASLPVGAKLMASFACLVIIILSFAGAYYAQTDDQIHHSRQELYGNAFIRELRPLLTYIPQHRGTSAAIRLGDEGLASTLPGIRARVDETFSALHGFNPAWAADIAVGDQVTRLESQWKTLVDNADTQSAAEHFSAHTDLIAAVQGVIHEIGKTSKLLLTPDLDSFFLMETIVVRSPAMGEYAVQARGLGAGIVARQFITPAEMSALEAARTRLHDALVGIVLSLHEAGEKTPALAAKLKPVTDTLELRGKQAETLFSRVIQEDFAGMTPKGYFTAMSDVIAANSEAAEQSADLLDELLQARIDNQQRTLVGAMAVVLIALVLASTFTALSLRQQNRLLTRANGHFQGIRDGNFSQSITWRTKDAFGQLFEGLSAMQTDLQARREADTIEMAANSRIKQGLDSVNTSTMIADADSNIIYLNQSAQALMKASHDNLRSILPAFDQATVLGSNFDIFHANPAHQRGLLARLDSTYTTEISVGQQIFQLIANPVFDDAGDRLGTIVEWEDKTLERAVEKEIEAVVNAASAGDLSARIDEAGKAGFTLALAKGVNQMAASAESIVTDTNDVMSAMASGDLTQRIDAQYQGQFGALAGNVNQTIEQLTTTIDQILKSSEQIRAGAEEIAQGNADLSHRTEEQASSLEETASSMEQMTGLVRQTAENARNVNSLAATVRDDASKGGNVVQQAVDAMGAISESSKQISDIITVIDEIAFQTNLLALNAAVEAARAGEQGRGFAVVAGEVRSLAQRSAEAAKEIKDLIRDSSGKVADGTKLVNQSGDTLQSLVTSIAEVATQVSEITSAADEQSSGIEQVNTAITQMDEMTQQNAALVEEASAAGENMAEQARSMNTAMGFFHVERSTVTSPVPSVAAKPVPNHTSSHEAWSEF